MKLAWKIVLGLTGLVLALVLVAAIAVAVLFKPKDYQPLLVQAVAEATGRTFTLDGDLGLDFFPCCSITLGHAALGNPPGFPAGEFASVEAAALSLKVWPLIARREVEIGTVKLDGLKADLIVRDDGLANWQFDGARRATAESSGDSAGAPKRLAIEGIDIRNGRVAYRNDKSRSSYLAEKLDLEMGEVSTGTPFDLKLATALTDRSDGTTGTVKLEATATLAPDQTHLDLQSPRLDITATGKAVPGKQLTSTLNATSLGVDLGDATHFAFKDLQVDFALPGFTAVAGDLEGSMTVDAATLGLGPSSELVIPSLKAMLKATGDAIPGKSIEANIKTGNLSVDLDKLWGSIDTLSADVSGLGAQLVVSGRGRVAASGADLMGTFVVDTFSPRSVFAILKKPEPNTADPTALTRLSGSGQWVVGKDFLRLQALDFQLDQTRLQGNLGFTGFTRPLMRFDIRLGDLDLDRYLAPEVEGADAAAGSSATKEADDIPVDTLRDLRLDGKFRVENLTYAKAKLAALSVVVRAADGQVKLDPLTAKLYDGEYRGAIGIDATGPTARLTTEQHVTGMQVGKALKDIYQNEKLTGALSGSVSATGTGNTSNALLRTLDGNVNVSIANGAYLGTDLWHEIRSARALIKGEAAPEPPANPQTKFNALELAGRMTDGVFTSDKLLAEIPFTRLTGAGALNLVEKTLDYRLQAQVFETPTFADGRSFKDLNGLTIPLTLKGAMAKPKVSVDLKGLALGAATEKLREKLLKKLGEEPAAEQGTGEQPATDQAAPSSAPAEQQKKEDKPRDVLKRSLRDLLKGQ